MPNYSLRHRHWTNAYNADTQDTIANVDNTVSHEAVPDVPEAIPNDSTTDYVAFPRTQRHHI